MIQEPDQITDSKIYNYTQSLEDIKLIQQDSVKDGKTIKGSKEELG